MHSIVCFCSVVHCCKLFIIVILSTFINVLVCITVPFNIAYRVNKRNLVRIGT